MIFVIFIAVTAICAFLSHSNLIATGCIHEVEYVDHFSWSTDVILQNYNITLK